MIPPEELTLLRSIKRTAAALLVIMRLDPRPIGETELAELLDINVETARGWLRSLSRVNLVARSGRYQGYILTYSGKQLILPTAEIPRSLPSTTTTTLIVENDISEEAVVEESETSAENPRSTAENPRSIALKNAGIGEPKRSQLAKLDHLTPEIISQWEKHLKKEKGKAYKVGLLIHILESGDELPPNQNDHSYFSGPFADYVNH